jgi:hypothetical protein
MNYHRAPQTRRERLADVAAENAEELHDQRAARQLRGLEPASRYAAVTSEGPLESSRAAEGHLIVADSAGAVGELLHHECGRGRVAHGRVWDLDACFDPSGNLNVSYAVRVGEDPGRSVYLVDVEGGDDGSHLFDDLPDAEALVALIRSHGGEAKLRRKPVNDHRLAGLLIDTERER